MMYGELTEAATRYLAGHPQNHVQPEDAIRPDLVGMRLFDAPIFAVGAADDPLFAALRDPQAVHPEYRLPGDWVPGAKSVLSFFVPYTARIREANARDMRRPADEWLHGRIEGEDMVMLLRTFLRDALVDRGFAAVAPPADARFAMLAPYAANWSERHTGYICGLGTFGLSKGLITAKGTAGRLGSVVTDCPLPVTPRPYDSLYAYCNACGACARHCPAQAIDPAKGMGDAKAHAPCDAFVSKTREEAPRRRDGNSRYGCGKCQVAVPCMDRIPV